MDSPSRVGPSFPSIFMGTSFHLFVSLLSSLFLAASPPSEAHPCFPSQNALLVRPFSVRTRCPSVRPSADPSGERARPTRGREDSPGEVFQCFDDVLPKLRCPGGAPGRCAVGRDPKSLACSACIAGYRCGAAQHRKVESICFGQLLGRSEFNQPVCFWVGTDGHFQGSYFTGPSRTRSSEHFVGLRWPTRCSAARSPPTRSHQEGCISCESHGAWSHVVVLLYLALHVSLIGVVAA